MHLRAATGIELRHCGHSRSVAACLRISMSSSLPTGMTTRKYTTAAMMTKVTSALMKSP